MADELQRFTIEYAPFTKQHLRTIEAKYYSLIRALIDEQLSFDPNIKTRNRQPLKRPAVFMATWEIRFGPHNRFCVYYDVDLKQAIVSILAISIKEANRIVLGGEEMQL